MTKKTVVIVSVIRELLDVPLVGQFPFVNWILNVPVIYLHYRYAGPRALITLIENVPGVGMLPCFTALALSYPDHAYYETAKTVESKIVNPDDDHQSQCIDERHLAHPSLTMLKA